MHDFFYHGIWRMDWGLGNPNKTAALITMLMISAWWLAYVDKGGFWISLALFTGLGVGLIHTFSRGGIIALVIGILPVIYFAKRPWKRGQIVGASISVWIMVSTTIYLDAQDRYGQGVIKEDRSIGNRIELWKAAPKMMVDAPGGWGFGKSGRAYMEWYQPLDHSEEYRTLVNSHLTWLVELGWPLRYFYIFCVLSIILICWPSRALPTLSIPLGVWLAFDVAAFFSSVAESFWLWVLPIASLLVALSVRWTQEVWPKLKIWTVPAIASGGLIIVFLMAGSSSTSLRNLNGTVVIGQGPPDIWIVANTKIMGPNYGHAIRRYLASTRSETASIGIIESTASLPALADQVIVLAGQASDGDKATLGFLSPKRIVLLNPAFYPQEIKAVSPNDGRITVYFGEFSQSPAATSWQNYATVRRLPGVGDFLPQWPELALVFK